MPPTRGGGWHGHVFVAMFVIVSKTCPPKTVGHATRRLWATHMRRRTRGRRHMEELARRGLLVYKSLQARIMGRAGARAGVKPAAKCTRGASRMINTGKEESDATPVCP